MIARFLILFAATNSLALGAWTALAAGGVVLLTVGGLLAVAAAGGFLALARIVVLARPRETAR